MKLKHGEKIFIKWNNNQKIYKGKISIEPDGGIIICYNSPSKQGYFANNKLGFKYSWKLNNNYTNTSIEYIKPQKNRLEKIKEILNHE